MANLKLVILKKQPSQDGRCRIYVQITHKGNNERLKTKWYVLPDQWKDCKVQGGRNGDPNFAIKNLRLSELMTNYEKILLDNESELKYLDAKAIRAFLEDPTSSYITDFFKFTQARLDELKANGNTGTWGPLNNTLRVVREYHKSASLNFSEITPRFLDSFKAHYRKEGHKINSIAVYMRYIRSMFNLAIDEYNVNAAAPVILNYPFRKHKIETAETANRNLSIDLIRAIRDLDPTNKREEITRDIFTLQMYLTAINIKDLYWLPPMDDRIKFSRAKTGRYHDIKIEPEALAIIDKYKGEKYLLRFADLSKKERTVKTKAHARVKDLAWGDSETFNKMLNETLQKIQDRLKWSIQGDLTTYYARHSVASLMRDIGISKDDISLCLGHLAVEKNLKTTGGYIKEDFEKIDLANRELIDFINSDVMDGKAWKEYKESKNQAIKEAQNHTLSQSAISS